MRVVAEITELNDYEEKGTSKDEIEAGLEIVESEMGNILEELKENVENVLCNKNDNNTSEKEKNLKKLSISTRKIFTTHQKIVNSKPKYQVQKTNYGKRLKSCFSGSPKSSIMNVTDSKYKDTSRRLLCQVSRRFSATSTTEKNQKRTGLLNPLLEKRSTQNIKGVTEREPPYNNYIFKTSAISKIIYDNNEQLRMLKEQLDIAIREKKTFTVCGNYYSIRRALLVRGWVEKLNILNNTYDKDNLQKLQAATIPQLLDGIHDPQTGYIYKRVIISKLLGKHQVDFYWDQSCDSFRLCNDNKKITLINRFRRGIFGYTSKQGLCESVKTAYWFQRPGISNIRHPRSYNLSNADDPREFMNDFKLTSAMSLLKWVTYNIEQSRNSNKIISKKGTIPLKIFYFAVAELSKVVQRCKHEDIDYEIEEALDCQWNEFLEYYYKIIHAGYHFKSEEKKNNYSLLQHARSTLKKVEQFWPHLSMDGVMNIWMLKPTNGSRGEGIHLCRTLQYILKIIKFNSANRYIVQKYIERPLLIHSTKFDIRQWFLISCARPLTVWIYKECYIRFSSQLYNLHKLHESIHLTNNSIQSKYRNGKRNPALPPCNMWDSKQFQNYLTRIGHPDVLKQVIYPGIKESLTGAILTNQCNLDTRKNCFELYGSDFMLTEDFQPWLIEINSKPALHASTSVTARMCPQVLEDLIRVVIDHAKNPNASTGRFELLYKENLSRLPATKPEELQLTGKQLPVNYFYTPEFCNDGHLKNYLSSRTNLEYTHYNIKEISSEMKKTLENLLSIIQNQHERKKQSKHQYSQVTDITEIFTNKNLLKLNDNTSSEGTEISKPDSTSNETNSDNSKPTTVTTTDEEIKNNTSESNSKKSINLKVTKSTVKSIKPTKIPISAKLIKKQFLTPSINQTSDPEILEALNHPATVTLNEPENIFVDMMHSVRSLSLARRK